MIVFLRFYCTILFFMAVCCSLCCVY